MASSSLEQANCEYVARIAVRLLELMQLQDTGVGKGKYYSCNIPLRDGITDDAYKDVFEPVCPAVPL